VQSCLVDKKLALRKAFGLLVRRRRTEIGLTQENLALEIHIDRTYVSGIERGRRNPTLSVISTLAEGLNTTASGLLNGLEGEVKRGRRA
jgi:transcriptional regulator with XRE-family HTH domain